MTRRLTNPDGSYFEIEDDEEVRDEGGDDDAVTWWYQDPNGWWKNPTRPGEPKIEVAWVPDTTSASAHSVRWELEPAPRP